MMFVLGIVGRCPVIPFVQDASLLHSDDDRAVFQCLTGHRFPDGHLTKTIECLDEVWHPDTLDPCLSECSYMTVPFPTLVTFTLVYVVTLMHTGNAFHHDISTDMLPRYYDV